MRGQKEAKDDEGRPEGFNLVLWTVRYLRKLRHILMKQNISLANQVHISVLKPNAISTPQYADLNVLNLYLLQVINTLIAFAEGNEHNIECIINGNTIDVINALLQQSYISTTASHPSRHMERVDIKSLTVSIA